MPAQCGPPGQDGGHRRGAHDARALDRGAAAGQRDVEGDEREDQDEPRPQRQPHQRAQPERERGQERDVLPARRDEVGQAGGADVVPDAVGQRPVLPERHAAQQRGGGGRDAVGERRLGAPAGAVDGARDASAASARGDDPSRVQRAVRAADPQPGVVRTEPPQDAAHPDDVARRRTGRPRDAGRGPDEQPAPADARERDDGAAGPGAGRLQEDRVTGRRHAVAHARRRGVERREPRLAAERPGQHRGDQPGREHASPRAGHGERERGQRRDRARRPRPRQ